LKEALLNADYGIEPGFVSLPDGQSFPVSMKELNRSPNKLLQREFHSEMILVIEEVRRKRKMNMVGSMNGVVFFGPSGTGKSWSSMALLLFELKSSFGDANGSQKAVIYFDSVAQCCYIFTKERNVKIEAMVSPNVIAIPELKIHNTVLIYDASRGSGDVLPNFPCEYFIFSSPNAGNYKQVEQNHGLVRMIAPNWSKEELLALAKVMGYHNAEQLIDELYRKYGGSPRAVVTNDADIYEASISDASALIQKISTGVHLSAMNDSWPSHMFKAKYHTGEIAVTGEAAYQKYLHKNISWDYTSNYAKDLVFLKYEEATEVAQVAFENWLRSEKKAAALFGYFWEYKFPSLLLSSTISDIEYKALDRNEKLSKDQDKLIDEVFSETPDRSLTWVFPTIKEVQVLKDNLIEGLRNLKDQNIMYRLPQSFPLIDFFNPPNNCFSLGVGDHTLKLDQAVSLSENLQVRQVNFIFTTTSANYPSVKHWQSFEVGKETKAFGKLPKLQMQKLAKLVQFCMRFKKF
jgi:hypothetical protein